MRAGDVSECRELAWAHDRPEVTGRIRLGPEDFVVVEDLGWAPSGEGEHVFVRVRKRGTNTDWLARQLAAFAGVKPDAVAYAGLKDRHALTEQWFSLHLPGRAAPDWSGLALEGVEVLETTRHDRKLKRGALAGNRFRIVVRALDGGPAELLARLPALVARGVPNYFGEQRFGLGGGNLPAAAAWLRGERKERDRHTRGLLISSARAFVFNAGLDARVQVGSWDTPLPGEVLMLDGTHSVFACETPDEAIRARALELDVHPTGPLWGRGASLASGEALHIEQALRAAHEGLCAGLEREDLGLRPERRALRLPVRSLEGEALGADALALSFWLPAGSYATVVLRELVRLREA